MTMKPPDDGRWRRMPVPRMPPELGMTIRQFPEASSNRRDELMREIARQARSRPEDLARILAQWLHEDDDQRPRQGR